LGWLSCPAIDDRAFHSLVHGKACLARAVAANVGGAASLMDTVDDRLVVAAVVIPKVVGAVQSKGELLMARHGEDGANAILQQVLGLDHQDSHAVLADRVHEVLVADGNVGKGLRAH
jgi:hypothetical protein